MDSLLWFRYKFTLEYKKRKYNHRYNNLKKRYEWDSNYWKNIEYVFEAILKYVYSIYCVLCLVILLYIITTGALSEPINLLLLIPVVSCIVIGVSWFIMGKKAIAKYKPNNSSISSESDIKEPDTRKYTQEERNEYTKFWEGVNE